ncbi:hypothetical protein AOLI_G00227000 [Acnodon oligacanthus]
MALMRGLHENSVTSPTTTAFCDGRVDENIALTSIHTLFVREHNRLARALRILNPQWSSETLYQEARKIIGAYRQIVVFRHYLPHIVGPDAMRSLLGPYPGYNPSVDPSIANVFATAAFCFAHMTIQPLVFRLDENFLNHPQFPSVPLFHSFFTPWRVIFEGGIDPLIHALISRPAKLNQQDHMLLDAQRERLFAFTSRIAMDLASLNMQRSHDHALPGYTAWRRFCNLSTPQNEAELAVVLNNTDLARRLIALYGNPANIDVWVAGVSEPFVPGGRVGPLFSCLIATQFQKIRQGDSEIVDLDLTPWIEAGEPDSYSLRSGDELSDSSSSSPIPVRLITFRNTIYNDLNDYSNQTGDLQRAWCI